MIRRLSTYSYSKFDPTFPRHVSSQRALSDHNISPAPSQQSNYTLPLNSISKRRVENSPTLPLEAVALPALVREQIRKYIVRQNLSARLLRANATSINLVRAPESLAQKSIRNLGRPIVQPPPTYDPKETASFVALRMPGTFAANVFVMAEAARLSPDFVPNSFLDFGSGPGTSLIAASRVFSQSQDVSSLEGRREDLPTIRTASLVDKSAHMQSLAAEIAHVDPYISSNTTVTHASSLRECNPQETFDIVCSSYSLNEIARDAMSSPLANNVTANEHQSVSREDRYRLAEKRLRRTTKALWSRTAPNGMFFIIEDGTAAGFETVAFVRDTILKMSPPLSDSVDESTPLYVNGEDPSNENCSVLTRPTARANVVAPCLHSKSCPLNGSITRHRICRFQQRLNRPQISRSALPMATGYEDEYFSFLVVQKLVSEGQEARYDVKAKNSKWGRLIRQPLLKGKHVALDACTNEATLERRVISKKNSPEGMYSRARRAKWGDVWSRTPLAAPQQLNF